MKKLVISAFAIAFSVIANASTVNWSASGIAAAPVLTDRSTYVAYFFEGTSSYTSIVDSIAAGDMSVLTGSLGNKSVSASGSIIGAKATGASYDVGEYAKGFVVILNATAPADASWYMAIAEKTSSTAVSSAGTATIGFGTQAANTWVEIAPEPTSGLMMLLGMGVLALRRRRA